MFCYKFMLYLNDKADKLSVYLFKLRLSGDNPMANKLLSVNSFINWFYHDNYQFDGSSSKFLGTKRF